jgi:Fic family protein
MDYQKIEVIEKIEQLQKVFIYSTRLAEKLGVSSRTLLNWQQKPQSISAKHRLDIDVLYCQQFLLATWDNPKHPFEPIMLPDDMMHNAAIFLPFLRRLSYGTLEIETDMTQTDFDRIIDSVKLPKNMTTQTFYEGFNTFMTHKYLWQRIIKQGELFPITVESIKNLHADLMLGVHDDAGFFSTKIRVMGKLDGIYTTLPDDIDEEMHRFVYKAAKSSTLDDIAKNHAYFMLIHPFGDGNGRVGRALVMAQCLNAQLMPPVFNSENNAMYYAAMEHAMRHGRYAPLVRLFYETAKLTHAR